LQLLEKNSSRVLTTILIAKNLADVTAATFGAGLMSRVFYFLPESVALWLGIALVTILILIFGEIIPKIIAKANGERFFSSTLGITNVIYYGLFPLVNWFVPVANFLVNKLIRNPQHETSEYVTSEQEIRFLIDYITEKGIMESEKTSMLRSIFELGSTPVRDIMVPATDIVSIDINTSPVEALDVFSRYQFSRLPVYVGSPDNVLGMLHLKDLFALFSKHTERPLRDIIRPILFVPESTKVNQLLKEFKHQHMHIGVVINEYGSIIGLVTLEDVLEEIVGEIRDEYESVPQKIVPLKPGSWLVDASAELKDLSPLLNISFETEGSHTLGGFLNEQFQHLPKKGERLVYKDYCFQVQQAGSKRVLQVLVFRDMVRELQHPPTELQ
jgi:CBS domain containing-hemolysin-like protein